MLWLRLQALGRRVIRSARVTEICQDRGQTLEYCASVITFAKLHVRSGGQYATIRREHNLSALLIVPDEARVASR